MRKVLSATQMIEAKALAQQGISLEGIRVRLGLKCSRMTLSRAIREVTTAEERIATYRRTGQADAAMTVGEVLIAMER